MNKEWLEETNIKKWMHKGLHCLIIRHPDAGHLCGYVQIPKGHILYNHGYTEYLPQVLMRKWKKIRQGNVGKRGAIDIFCQDRDHPTCGFFFDVHGGITLSGKPKGEQKGFWYGFDCGHSGDLSPFYEVSEEYKKYNTYRNMDYVTAETERLAEQILNARSRL